MIPNFILSWDGRKIGDAGEASHLPEDFRKMVCEAKLDEFRITWRPCVIGGAKAPPLTGLDETFFPRGVALELVSLARKGDEFVARYRIRGKRR